MSKSLSPVSKHIAELLKGVVYSSLWEIKVFKTHDWVIKGFQTKTNSLHKGFPQRRWAVERPSPFVGGGPRPPPLWRLAFGLLEFVLPSI